MQPRQSDQEPQMARRVLQHLESLERAGITHLPKPRAKAPSAAAGPTVSAAKQDEPVPIGPGQQTGLKPPVVLTSTLFNSAGSNAQVVPAAERPVLLDIVRTEVAGCTRCSELAAGRTQTVFGVGNPNARLMFIGEAPGADEDRQGEPFVGRAGQLLTRIIEACRLTRDQVYIANVIKCRPPGNRNPLPDEVINCRGYLERQVAIIRPEFICCLGAVAAQAVLKTEMSIGRLRGKFHDYEGIPVVCTYHPAYLLRNPDAKRFTWDDMKMLMLRMGVEL
ncbi:MAG TPA: uracil-DNA glycosylase [Pirellulales bacterium]|nr:uracil-DNA glycosylase [Pirellulales bacterium]